MAKIYRLMAIDYGEKRVGIALTDPLRIFSKPYIVLQRESKTFFPELNQIILEKQVQQVILGLPCNLSGEDTKKTLEVREFAKVLRQNINVPIVFWDERYSSVEANESLKKAGYSVKDARKVVDKVAASIILKSYLQANQ